MENIRIFEEFIYCSLKAKIVNLIPLVIVNNLKSLEII